ncbi:phosphatidic acid phosphatase type 2/haloperoxidase [Jimgerdemannia flammicorona]|uniref:Phosphatidic acid phosphatase type 2/haloperoxidase n=1 Tax=Jimgerdemannia flammicorona TaxID=994334 RepID=A0A433QG17_9FUNG|nr:phosphatidic acid phosphatase type 2/haloperoxidase [Jimgerdemannia flammicorona]
MYPYAEHEKVPTGLLVVVCFIVPLVVISCIALLIQKSPFDLHNGVMGLLLSLALTIMVTEVVKLSVGRPRPDFLDRCKPIPGSVDPPLGLSNSTICMPTDKYILSDGFKSFPSGHSSMSFGGLAYLSFYLAGKLHVFDQRGHTYKGFIFALPMVGAALIAISRTEDYRHHWQDVTFGGIIGVVFAYFSYHQYYPSLRHHESHKPFSPRIARLSDSDRVSTAEQALTADFDLPSNSPSRDGSLATDLESVRIDHSGNARRGDQSTAGHQLPSATDLNE